MKPWKALIAVLLVFPVALSQGVLIQSKNLEIRDGNLVLSSGYIYSPGPSPVRIFDALQVETLRISHISSCDFLYTNSSGDVSCGSWNSVSFPWGTGDPNRIAKWISTNSLGSSIIYESGGKVGIGTEHPDYELDVHGNARITGTIYAEGKVCLDGSTCNAYIYYDSSNSRLVIRVG